jgi:hypothetical protein
LNILNPWGVVGAKSGVRLGAWTKSCVWVGGRRMGEKRVKTSMTKR